MPLQRKRHRRRRDRDEAVSREEFEALRDDVYMVLQRSMFGRTIEAVGDDTYRVRYPGVISDSDEVGGYAPGEIPYITDGIAPASSPTPVAEGGFGWIAVKWPSVANADIVTYEVHVSSTTGFTPSASTLAGETPGNMAFVERLPNGGSGTAFAYGTTYYVKIIAKDEDGAAAAGAQDSTTLVKGKTNEIQTDGGTPDWGGAVPTTRQGPGWIKARWGLPTGTDDPLFYHVFLDTSSGFTPNFGTNFIGTTFALEMVISRNGSNVELNTATDYYVKVMAVSDLSGNNATTGASTARRPGVMDGSITTIQNLDAGNISTGFLSAARIATGSLDGDKITANTISANELEADSVTTSELAADAVVAENILAGEITAAHIEAILNMSSSFIAGSAFPGGANVQVGWGAKDDGAGAWEVDSSFFGIRSFDGSNSDPVFKLPGDGSPAQFKGVVKFGSTGDSKLLQNDSIQLLEQTTGSHMTALNVQSSNSGGHDDASASCSLDNDPVVGNVVIAVVTSWDGTGNAGYTMTGWTNLHSLPWGGSSNGRTAVFGKVVTGSLEGGPSSPASVTFDKTADIWTINLMEFSGITLVENNVSEQDEDNSGGVMNVNTTGISGTSQPCLLLGIGTCWGIWQNFGAIGPVNFPSFKPSSYPAGWTMASMTEWKNNNNPFRGPDEEIETITFYKNVDSADTSAFIMETNSDAGAASAIIIALERVVASVEPAEANTVRLYAQDISSNTYLHTTDEDGRESAVALGAAGEVWRFEIVSTTVNVNGGAAIGAHSGGSDTKTGVTGLVSGDYVIIMGQDHGNNYLKLEADPNCTTNGEVVCRFMNTDSVSRTPGSTAITLLIIHRS